MAVIPTMRVPDNVSWHKDLVYNCMWSLLCEIVKWNRNPNQEPIRTVLSTGLGTGTGYVHGSIRSVRSTNGTRSQAFPGATSCPSLGGST
jgi:hypothetical protein